VCRRFDGSSLLVYGQPFQSSKHFYYAHEMANLTVKQIHDFAIDVMKENQGGIRFSKLVRRILDAHPETPKNTVATQVASLEAKHPEKVSKPSRGLFVPILAAEGVSIAPTAPSVITKAREEEFYQLFADWLKSELDEATVAISLGGAGMQKKWGTPDVVGVYKPLASHRIKSPVELISAEIKVDPAQPVVAFGQAAAYRRFSAKSYIVMPDAISEEDYSRLEALCILFGIGLVLFKVNPDEPGFQIRVRAQRYSPDMFYVNEFAERVYQHDVEMFNTLFG
jgi:hypothetical protein